MTDVVGSGRLLLITIAATTSDVQARIEDVLTSHAGADGVRRLHDGVFMVYADAEPATVRDWLVEALGASTAAFVVEFEHWSAAGGDFDARWLLRRGH